MMIAIIPLIILFVISYGMLKGIKVYDCFVEGAKEGLTVCYKIFPYLLAMIVAVSVFRESRALDFVVFLLSPIVKLIGLLLTPLTVAVSIPVPAP